jgi:hypothetical protein
MVLTGPVHVSPGLTGSYVTICVVSMFISAIPWKLNDTLEHKLLFLDSTVNWFSELMKKTNYSQLPMVISNFTCYMYKKTFSLQHNNIFCWFNGFSITYLLFRYIFMLKILRRDLVQTSVIICMSRNYAIKLSHFVYKLKQIFQV